STNTDGARRLRRSNYSMRREIRRGGCAHAKTSRRGRRVGSRGMFDWGPIRRAFFAGEYEKCRSLLEGAPRPRADLWLSWIDNRGHNTGEQIQRLLNIESDDAQLLAERDVWLAGAYNSTGQFDMAHQLVERALRVLPADSEM